MRLKIDGPINTLAIGALILSSIINHYSPLTAAAKDSLSEPRTAGLKPTTGLLWINDLSGFTGDFVTLEICAIIGEEPVNALTIVIEYDQTMVYYHHGCVIGDLIDPEWELFDCGTAYPYDVIVMGFSFDTSIPPESVGCLVQLTFQIRCPDCEHGDASELVFTRHEDDFANYEVLNSMFTFDGCRNNGDLTGDHILSAHDAQIAFSIALGIYSPSDLEFCSADCNGDGTVTAGDAAAIFGAIFGGTCVDPI